ncbi:MAG: Rhodothermus phage [Bacteroidota bacterium]|jgi:hypothetical protein
MATTYKSLSATDVASTKTLLNESIPITGSIVSGTYNDNNIKNYSHQIFQSVYDYPYLSSSANHIFDISFGHVSASPLSASNAVAATKKINIYNQFAQLLVGYDTTGSILRFDQDGDLTSGSKHNEVYFMAFSRLLVKDEIKKGSFSLTIGTGSHSTPFSGVRVLSDTGAATEYRVNSPAGEYGLLYTGSTSGTPVGLIYYQAGIVAFTASVMPTASYSGSATLNATLSGSTIQTISDTLRRRIQNIQFNNTTELNSTIYFCRANHNEFNYSSNPTYLSSSKMVVKNTSTDAPVSYITTVGLYSADNELLAVAKLSEPLKKDPTNELTIRVRLDY